MKLLYIIFAIITVLVCFMIGGLIFWGLGCLIINVFNIDYTWTFMHGLCVQIILWILGNVFRGN